MQPGSRRILLLLVAGALFLPIAVLLVLTAGRLLTALDDASGALLMERLALLLGVLWAFAAVTLPIVLALRTLAERVPLNDEEGIEE